MPRKDEVLVLYIVQGDLQRQAEKRVRQTDLNGGEASCRLGSSGVVSGLVWGIVGRAVVREGYCGGRRAGARQIASQPASFLGKILSPPEDEDSK